MKGNRIAVSAEKEGLASVGEKQGRMRNDHISIQKMFGRDRIEPAEKIRGADIFVRWQKDSGLWMIFYKKRDFFPGIVVDVTVGKQQGCQSVKGRFCLKNRLFQPVGHGIKAFVVVEESIDQDTTVSIGQVNAGVCKKKNRRIRAGHDRSSFLIGDING